MELATGQGVVDQSTSLSITDLCVSLLSNFFDTPNIQGCRVVFLGKDRVGAYYTNQSITLAKELRQYVKKGMKQGSAELESHSFQRSISLAARAAFMIQT